MLMHCATHVDEPASMHEALPVVCPVQSKQRAGHKFSLEMLVAALTSP